MRRGLAMGTIVSLVLTLLMLLIFFDSGVVFWKFLAVIFGTVLYHLSLRLALHFALDFAPLDWLDWKQDIYTPRRFEKNFYESLSITKWKRFLPGYDEDMFDERFQSWDDILINRCQEEITHWLCAFISIIPAIVGPILFRNFWLFFLTSLIAIIYDMGFVMIQRYDRPRNIAMLRRRERDRDRNPRLTDR